MKKILPRKDNVLLEVYKETNKAPIILPDQYDDEIAIVGKVVAAGPETTLKADDLVLFKKHLFDEVVFSRTEVYLLGKEENITAIVK